MAKLAGRTRSSVLLLTTVIFVFETLAQPVLAMQTHSPATTKPVATTPRERVSTYELQQSVNRQMVEAMKTGFGGRDPAMRDLMSIDLRKIDGIIPNFSGNAPVDADPFFMRSQGWHDSNEKVKDYSIVGDKNSTEILLPGSTRKLVLNLPLRSLIATDEYLFFTLHPESDLYDRVTGVKNADGEGLFVIETTLLAMHARRGTPVPVHYLPIMGNGAGRSWRTGVKAAQIIEGDILAVSNASEVIPFLMKDIREIIQISKINLDLSMMITMTKRDADGKISSEKLMPAPGSTALFGLVLTGLDTSRPGYNFFRDIRSAKTVSVNGANLLEKMIAKIAQHPTLRMLTIPQAKAESGDPVADAIARSAVFGSIVAVTIVTAFVLKYKSPAVRKRLDEIHKYRRALDPETVDRERAKGFREFVRIEGSILASIAQFPLITPSIAIQYFVDRAMPGLGAGDHTLMRKVLHQTVYPNLRHFGHVAVNEKVTLLGTGYAATAGIGLGALHYWYVLPMFLQAVTPSLPEGLSYALNSTFSPDNRDTQAMLFTNLLVGASIGVLRGPADLTMDAKSQVVEDIHSRVDNDLRRLGINPDDPKVQTRRSEMNEALINLTLVQKGLPSSAEVLFDTMTLYSSAAKSRGYATPSNDVLLANVNNLADVPYRTDAKGNKTLGEDGKPEISEGAFILASRRGLLPNVLSRAHAQAVAWHNHSQSADSLNALRLIEQMRSQSERLRTMLPKAAQAVLRYMQQPSLLVGRGDKTTRVAQDLQQLQNSMREISARALAFRQMIVMSSYEGPTEYAARYLPIEWKKNYGERATNMAVLYLRQALASYLDGAKTENVVARNTDISWKGDKARSLAMKEMRAQRPELEFVSNAALLADPNLRTEVAQRANIIARHEGDQARAETLASRYEPKTGAVEDWRHRRALRRAEARLARFAEQNASHPAAITKDALETRLRDLYTVESGREIGLYVQGLAPSSMKDERGSARAPWQSSNEAYDTMISELQQRSEAVAKQQLESLNLKTYIAKLSPADQASMKLQTYATVFLAGYRDATTMAEGVSGVDSAQPGMTQRLRIVLARQTGQNLQTLEAIEANASRNLDRKLLRFHRGVVSMGASTTNRTLRFVDSMFNDQSIDRGVLGVIQRRVPFAEEMVSANMRNLKFWPVAFSVSWAWSHFILGTGIGYSFWVTSIITQGIFVMMPVQWLFRNYRMQSFKPFDSKKAGWSGVGELAGKYSLSETLGYAVTFFAIMPAVLLTTEVGAILTSTIGDPIAKQMQTYSVEEVAGVTLAGLVSYIAGSKFFEKWKMKKTLAKISSLDDKKIARGAELDMKAVEQTAKTSLSARLANAMGRVSAKRSCEALFRPSN